MAELNQDTKNRSRKRRTRRISTRVDFTPMVDLGFLLITFFMLTTSLIIKQAMPISMPSNNPQNTGQCPDSLAITVLIAKNNNVYYYFGAANGETEPKLIKTDYTVGGLRKMLLERNWFVMNQIRNLSNQFERNLINDSTFKKQAMTIKEAKYGPQVFIKATDESSYNNLVNVLDEMNICNIGRYMIVNITPDDLSLIKKADQTI